MTDTAPSRAELLERITRLAGRTTDHAEAAAIARDARDRAILEADDAGIPHGEIAQAANLERMSIWRIVRDQHIRRRREQPIALEPDVA